MSGFRLHPLRDAGGRCPRDAEPLTDVCLRLPGWRTLLEGTCVGCGHRLLQDLPNGHGILYPATLDLDTGEVHDPGGAAWFSSWLRPAWERPDDDPVAFEMRGDASGRSVTVANCLDPVYGHAVLRMLAVQAHLDGDVLAVVPAALVPLVPEEVAVTWVVNEPIGRLRGWLLDLEERLLAEIATTNHAVLAPLVPHPHPSTYDVGRFVRVEPEPYGAPGIALSLRDDRRWGTDATSQAAKVHALVRAVVAAYSGARFAAVGPGHPGDLPPEVLDLRRPSPGADDERRWLSILRGSALAIGVHGSNLLLPSALAAATVELLPRERLSNHGQATVLARVDPVLALWEHRTIYGDADLADISAARVAEVAISVLDGHARFASLMTGRRAGVADPLVGGSASDPVLAEPRRPPSAADPTPVERVRALAGRAVGAAGAASRRMLAGRRPAPRYRGPLPVALRDRRGLTFELETQEEADAFVRHGGHFEGAELDLVSRVLEPGDVAIDVGANIGAFTATIARAVAPGGSVHAFEPLAAARRRLARTLELNDLTNVIVSADAVTADEDGAELSRYGPGFESWSTTVPRSIALSDRTLVPVTRDVVPSVALDAYCERCDIERLALLKVDVEGAEGRVLAGAQGLLARGAIDVLLIEVSDNTLEHAGETARALLARLEEVGMRPHVIEDGRVRPFRVAGRLGTLANVIAAGPAGRRRLTRAAHAH